MKVPRLTVTIAQATGWSEPVGRARFAGRLRGRRSRRARWPVAKPSKPTRTIRSCRSCGHGFLRREPTCQPIQYYQGAPGNLGPAGGFGTAGLYAAACWPAAR